MNHESIRYLWQLARSRIEEANDRLVIAGYSLPPSDLLARWLIGACPCTEAVVVNPDHSAGERVAALLPDARVEVVDDPRRLLDVLRGSGG